MVHGGEKIRAMRKWGKGKRKIRAVKMNPNCDRKYF